MPVSFKKAMPATMATNNGASKKKPFVFYKSIVRLQMVLMKLIFQNKVY